MSHYEIYQPGKEANRQPAPPPHEPTAPPPPPPPPAFSAHAESAEQYDIFETAKDAEPKMQSTEQRLAQRAQKVEAERAALVAAEQQKIDTLVKEKEEHARRVEAENRKKRKLQCQHLAPAGASLKRATSAGGSFSVFGDDDEEGEQGRAARTASAAVGSRSKHGGAEQGSGPGISIVVAKPPVVLDAALVEFIMKTANWAVNNVEKFEVLLQNSKNNEKLFFLNDKLSPAGLKFTEEYNRARAQLEVQRVCNEPLAAPADPCQVAVQTALAVAAAINSAAPAPKVSFASCGPGVSEGKRSSRKNRWGPPANQEAASAIRAAPAVDPLLERQLREQREMQLLEARIREAASHQQSQTQKEDLRQVMLGDGSDELQAERMKQYLELAALDEVHPRRDRDTAEDAEAAGGVVEGGSWEHRKRAKEMLATAQKSAQLTMLASDKHHIADFLPAAELDRFLKKSQAAASGESLPVESNYVDHKLSSDNVGFQMLRKAGWAEGSSLGSAAAGVSEPISVSAASASGVGVGVSVSHEVAEGDSEFESYRKRMMLAYKFRPNPLNNPRRDYY